MIFGGQTEAHALTIMVLSSTIMGRLTRDLHFEGTKFSDLFIIYFINL